MRKKWEKYHAQNAGKKSLLHFKVKRKCSHCKYEFTPHRLPLYLTRDYWRERIRMGVEGMD